MDEASFNEIPVATTQSSTLYLLDDQELRLMPWFMNAKKNGGSLTVTKDRAIRDDTRDIICFSRYIKYPLKNDDYYFIISVNLNKSRLDDLHRQVDSEGESLLIFDDGLQQIYASGEGNEEDYQAVRKEIGRREETSYWFTREIGGETCIVIGDNSATEGWTMVKIIPESQAQSVIFCGQFIHAILFCSLLLRLLSFDFSLRIFLAQAGQYLDAPEPGTYSTPHTVQFLAGIAAHRFVGMICNSSTKPMNL